jgi:murein L,D-transpeptidase YcbB/YkuD
MERCGPGLSASVFASTRVTVQTAVLLALSLTLSPGGGRKGRGLNGYPDDDHVSFCRVSLMNKRLSLVFPLCLVLLMALPLSAAAAGFQQMVQQLLPDDGKRSGRLPGGEVVYGKFFIQRMYKANNYNPLWNPASIRSLGTALSGLSADGLAPREYRFAQIRPYLDSPSRSRRTLSESAQVDILLTEAYLRALYHLYYGKADPQGIDPNNNFGQTRDGKDRSRLLLDWVKQARIDKAYDWARPNSPRYDWLRQGLVRYQRIKANGGWPKIPKGNSLKPGDTDSRVSLIRKRLTVTGDIATAAGSNRYDDGLLQAVKRFQKRHNLAQDGVIGPGTLGAMNVSVDRRIDEIRINLERQRWMLHEDKGEFLAVDIPGFMIYWSKNGKIIWQEQVQVGKKFTNTPIFKDRVRYIDFNPTWTIPPGILKRTILPALKKDPGYLNRKGYHLLGSNGQRMDPYAVNWKSLSRIPYTVRQPPGPKNALGIVKFMFPNKHHVFLHDTNHRELFAKQVRTTSSGCIRLRNPLNLAERLLADQGWNRARINRVIASGKTTRVNLSKPLRILIFYSTAWSDGKEVSFKRDIYKRDDKILAALNGPFKFHLRDLKPGERTARETPMDDAQVTSDAFDVMDEPPVVSPGQRRKAPSFLDY